MNTMCLAAATLCLAAANLLPLSSAVPEPAALLLFGLGLAAVARRRQRELRRAA